MIRQEKIDDHVRAGFMKRSPHEKDCFWLFNRSRVTGTFRFGVQGILRYPMQANDIRMLGIEAVVESSKSSNDRLQRRQHVGRWRYEKSVSNLAILAYYDRATL